MSFQHHGDSLDPALQKLFSNNQDELLKRFDQEQAGTAPEEFTNGQITPDDEGTLIFKIGSDPEKGVVAIEYSHPITWVAMQPQQAIDLAQALIKHARSIAKEPITITIH